MDSRPKQACYYCLRDNFMLRYEHGCNDRQWRAVTGLTQTQFKLIAIAFVKPMSFIVGYQSAC
jgi:hypothetical protein